jgi:hypothetical protein
MLMVKRLVSASVISLAVVLSTFSGALAAGAGAAPATGVSLPPNTPPLDCPPPVTSVVCSVLPTPVPCKGCSAPAAQPAAAPAAPTMTCSPDVSLVCAVLGATVCRKFACGIDAASAPAAAPAMRCAVTLQTLQCLLGGCPTNTCAATTGAAATPTATRIDCDISLICTVLALTVCRHGCALDMSGATAAPASSTRIDSPPGDPCSRQWPWPIETVCHL